MAKYIVRARYSNAAFGGMVSSPSDRGAAAQAVFASAGAKAHEVYYEASSGSVVVIVEGTAEQMSVVTMVVMASGAFSSVDATELISMSAMTGAMTAAQRIAKAYSAPNKS
ncbi:MAG: hypothetical protein RI906_3622 [Pseudomonadota bacterium]|jgi:uncharacterized protein with GYD domain